MHGSSSRETMERVLSPAGIELDGNRLWDVQVHNEAVFKRVLGKGSLGLGESYMEGWWDCPRLDEFFSRILEAQLHVQVQTLTDLLALLKGKLFNLQSPSRAFQIGQHHYDLGNKLYASMLDRHMVYSCGYWKEAVTLDEAQEAKLDLVCRKLGLQPGMRVLDIGCGWGSAAKFAVEQYQVEVVGITVSERQCEYARKLCEGLPVEIRMEDYRKLEGSFDRIFSLGMFEHVGPKNYKSFFETTRRCLKDEGLFLLHTIGKKISSSKTDPWISRYIFPNSALPTAQAITSNIEGVFVIEDWHSFGSDYDKTLMQWYRNFHDNWDSIKSDYDERFFRMWTYYLLSSAGSFRSRSNQLWQIVLSPLGVTGGYDAIR